MKHNKCRDKNDPIHRDDRKCFYYTAIISNIYKNCYNISYIFFHFPFRLLQKITNCIFFKKINTKVLFIYWAITFLEINKSTFAQIFHGNITKNVRANASDHVTNDKCRSTESFWRTRSRSFHYDTFMRLVQACRDEQFSCLRAATSISRLYEHKLFGSWKRNINVVLFERAPDRSDWQSDDFLTTDRRVFIASDCIMT